MRKNLKYSTICLLISIISLLFLLILLIKKEIENEKILRGYFIDITKNQELLKEVDSIKYDLIKSQDLLLKYMISNNNSYVKEYFGLIKNSQQSFKSVKINDLNVNNNFTKDKDKLNHNTDSIANKLISDLEKQNFNKKKFYKKLNFNKLGIKTTIKTERSTDSIKKQGLFTRLGKALANNYDITKEKVTHTIIVEYKKNKISGTLEEQFKVLLNKANRHYRNEIRKINNRNKLIKLKKEELFKTNYEIQQASNKLLDSYKTILKQQNETLNKKYNSQEINNRIKRFYLLLAIGFILLLLNIILLYIVRLASKYKNKLEKLTEKLDQNIRVKNKMVSMISHDVRSPLKIISIYIKQLLSLETDPKKKEIFNSVEYTSNSALILVNKILEYIENEQINATKNFVELNLFSEINNILEGFIHLAKENNNNLENINKVPEKTIVFFDRQKLQRLFFNILENAIKHTKNGTIYITSKYKELDDNKFKFDLIIKDTGKGIPKEQIKHLFTPFKKINKDSLKGVGLGLYLCKQIVKEYDGEIFVESKINEGTTVSISITSPIK